MVITLTGKIDVLEEWRPIAGFEGLYEVSNFGQVKRLDTNTLRKPVPVGGYLSVILYKHNQHYPRYVHLLVLEAFKSLRPAGLEGRHLNGDKNNCRDDNLAWGTSQENSVDTLIHGNHKQVKLSDNDVRMIRKGAYSGTIKDLASKLNVTEVTIYNAKSKKTYKHVKDEVNA